VKVSSDFILFFSIDSHTNLRLKHDSHFTAHGFVLKDRREGEIPGFLGCNAVVAKQPTLLLTYKAIRRRTGHRVLLLRSKIFTVISLTSQAM
jgi:hypothetical protein